MSVVKQHQLINEVYSILYLFIVHFVFLLKLIIYELLTLVTIYWLLSCIQKHLNRF